MGVGLIAEDESDRRPVVARILTVFFWPTFETGWGKT
jgi:hypothetical protein